MSEANVLVEKVDGHEAVRRLVLNRPDAHNAMNLAFMKDFRAAADEVASSGARAVVLAANGRAFSAGGDLGAFADADDSKALLKEMTDDLHAGIETLATMDAPIVAAVGGTAAGAGLSLACMCDLVIAGESAKFTMAYTGAGLSPDGSSTYFVPRLIGLRRTQELMFTNRVLSAQEALDWQLVNRVVADGTVDDEALALAVKLAAGPTGAYGEVKRLLIATSERSLRDQLALEGERISELSATPDGQEGIRAFLEKRKPTFEGR